MSDAGCERQILVVEDDADIRDALVELLADHGYQPLQAADGAEALAVLRQAGARPCVILLDVMMPVMDGRAFRHAQCADPALTDIPVIVLTAHANVAELAAGLHADAHLRKPVAVEALLAAVDSFCTPGTSSAA